MKLTNHQRIIKFMAQHPHTYFYYHDFMKPEVGVGYLANRRLQELKSDYPQIFETKTEGRQIKVKLKLDTIKDWYYDLPDGLKRVLREEGRAPRLTQEESLARLGLRIAE